MGSLTHNGEVLQSLPANASQINFDKTGTNLNSTQAENAIKEVNTKANTLQSEKADTDMVASDFSTAVSYTAGNYCIYEGKFYKFKNNHSGAWSAADVDEIKIAGELSSVKSGLTSLTTLATPTMLSAATLDEGGYIVVGNMVIFDITFTLTQNVTDTVALFRVPSAGIRNVGLRLTNANDGSEVSRSCRIYGNNVYAGITGNTGERYNVAGVYMKA